MNEIDFGYYIYYKFTHNLYDVNSKTQECLRDNLLLSLRSHDNLVCDPHRFSDCPISLCYFVAVYGFINSDIRTS